MDVTGPWQVGGGQQWEKPGRMATQCFLEYSLELWFALMGYVREGQGQVSQAGPNRKGSSRSRSLRKAACSLGGERDEPRADER